MKPFSLKHYLSSGLDIRVWGYAMIMFNSCCVSYALAYFMPIIMVENMGFSVVQAQCLGAPSNVFGAIIIWLTGWGGDKYRLRGPMIIFNAVLCVIGLPIMGLHPTPGVRYFGAFLVNAGGHANVPAVMSYQANNIRGQWKRAFCSSITIMFAGIGGIAGSLVFRRQDSPHYLPGIWACLTASCLSIIIPCLLSVHAWIQNKRADRGEIELECEPVSRLFLFLSFSRARNELTKPQGDNYPPGFRYTH